MRAEPCVNGVVPPEKPTPTRKSDYFPDLPSIKSDASEATSISVIKDAAKSLGSPAA
jgi:hypothetical protein